MEVDFHFTVLCTVKPHFYLKLIILQEELDSSLRQKKKSICFIHFIFCVWPVIGPLQISAEWIKQCGK